MPNPLESFLAGYVCRFVAEAGRAGLVLKEIEYTRNGKVYKRKQWVRAGAPAETPPAPPPPPEPPKPADPPHGNPALPPATRPALSPSESAAVAQYARGKQAGSVAASHHDVNDALREGKKLTGDAARLHGELQAAFAKAETLPEPVHVGRGITLVGGGLERFVKAAEQAKASGGPLTMNGYVSTSTRAGSAWAASNVQMEIAAVHGLDVGPHSPLKSEKELLLNHGSHFRVVGVERDGDKVRVKLEQLPPGSVPPPPPPRPGLLKRLFARLKF